MNKKIFKNILTGIITAMVIVFSWSAYSLIRFEGSFSPLYIMGLSNPYTYYQKYIGALLLKYGQEYKIDDVDTSKWKIYEDKNLGFEFKYPENNSVTVSERDNTSYYIVIIDNKDQEEKCKLIIKNRGWEVGKNWIPRKRRRVENNVDNNKKHELWYIKKGNGGIFKITSTKFEDFKKTGEKNIEFTNIIFASDKKPFKFIKISDIGNKCLEDTTRGIFKTFRFTEWPD